jgi:hypothetical protein
MFCKDDNVVSDAAAMTLIIRLEGNALMLSGDSFIKTLGDSGGRQVFGYFTKAAVQVAHLPVCFLYQLSVFLLAVLCLP